MADPAYIVDGVLTDGEAWVSLGTTTLASDAATVTFTSTDDGQVGDWSQYMDLVIVSYARGAHSSVTRQFNMFLNNDTGGSYPTYNYMMQVLGANGASTIASRGGDSGHFERFQVGTLPCANATANVFVSSVTSLFDINSGKYKSGFAQSACDLDGSGTVYLWGLTWLNTAPITEIDLSDGTSGGGDLVTGSMFSLFGVLPRMVA